MAQRINWTEMYANGNEQLADSLDQARNDGKKYYKGHCKNHGNAVLTTLDNACPLCVRENARTRRKDNKAFNRAREKTAEIKRRSASKNVEFDLTTDQIRSMLNETTHCPVFNKELEFSTSDWAPSIDRLDSEKGYTMDNVTVISNKANRIKSDADAVDILKVAIWAMKQEGLSDDQIRHTIDAHL